MTIFHFSLVEPVDIVDTIDTADIVHTVDSLDIVKSVNSLDNVSSVNSVHNAKKEAVAPGWDPKEGGRGPRLGPKSTF